MNTIRVSFTRIAVVVIGTLIAMSIAVVLALLRVPAQAQLAYVIGSLGTIITLQLDAIFRAIQGYDSGEEVSNAVAVAIRTPLSDSFRTLTETSLTGRARAHPVFRELARRSLQNCATQVGSFARGEVTLSRRDDDHLRAQVQRANRQIGALSFADVDMQWWLSDEGLVYIQENVRAARRGIEVKRAFIYTEWTEEIDRIARQYLAGGVGVRRIRADLLPVHAVRNLVVVDERFLLEHKSNASGETIGYLYASNSVRIDDARRMIDFVYSRAEAIT